RRRSPRDRSGGIPVQRHPLGNLVEDRHLRRGGCILFDTPLNSTTLDRLPQVIYKRSYRIFFLTSSDGARAVWMAPSCAVARETDSGHVMTQMIARRGSYPRTWVSRPPIDNSGRVEVPPQVGGRRPTWTMINALNGKYRNLSLGTRTCRPWRVSTPVSKDAG